MKNGGTIRTKEKCPVCYKSFTHIQKLGLICAEHRTVPNKYFVDLYYAGRQIKIYSYKSGRILDSYQIALETLEHIRYEIRNHQFDPTKYVKIDIARFLFQNLIKKWLDAKTDLISIFKYQQVNKNFFVFFNNTDVRDIRASHVYEFYQQLPDRLSEKTKKNIMDALKAFMNWAYRLEYVEKIPIFPTIKIDLKVPNWIHERDQEKILLALPEKDRLIYLFLMLHGCRPSEARALKVKDLDFENGTIIFRRVFTGPIGNTLIERTKTYRQRVIPINPEMENILRELYKDKLPEAFIFTDSKTGKPYPSRTLIKRWRAACEKVGKKIGLYEGSKHSFASQRVSKGISIYLISKVLGHTTTQTTERYAFADIEGMRKVMIGKE
jgi:integrase